MNFELLFSNSDRNQKSKSKRIAKTKKGVSVSVSAREMRSSSLVTVVAVLVVAMVMLTAEAQTPSCASQLIPCAEYLNATSRPPNTCCDPIKDAVAKDLACLCNLYENPSFLEGIGINVTQALNLPRLCGIPADVSACNRAPPPASQQQPEARPESSVDKIASTAIVGLLLISACMMLF